MSRKHFEAIALRLRDALDDARHYGRANGASTVAHIARDLAIDFAEFNPHFDSVRFFEAIGLTADGYVPEED